MSDPYGPSSSADHVIAALEAAVDAMVPAVAWIGRQVGRLALVAVVAGGLDAIMLASVAHGAGVIVAVVAAGCALAFGWYAWRLNQFVRGAPALRAELRHVTDLSSDGRVALEAAAGDLRTGSFTRRLRATEAISDTLGANPLVQRAGVARRQLLPENIKFVGWALALTVVLVLSLPVVALIALFAG